MPVDLLARVRVYASKHDLNLSQVIRRAIKSLLDEECTQSDEHGDTHQTTMDELAQECSEDDSDES